MKSYKTPLRYPGGKSRAAQKIEAYFPDLREYDEFREPFIGGGSVAIYIAKKFPDLKIWVNDLYEPLVNFWQQLQMFGGDMHDGIFMYLDPPYDIKDNLYGKKGSMHSGFDHDKFAEDCDKHDIPMMISYNSDQLVKDRFKNWKAAEFDLTYTMRSVGEYMRDQKQRKELLLMNYG